MRVRGGMRGCSGAGVKDGVVASGKAHLGEEGWSDGLDLARSKGQGACDKKAEIQTLFSPPL